VEMAWKTFAGQYDQVYEAILKQRIIEDNLPIEDSSYWFRIHLHRGISYLNNKLDGLDYFVTAIENTSEL
jgi:DNA sulfur modification protein DndE